MVFLNERTYLKAVEGGKVDEFHVLYEAAIEKVKGDFGQEHPIWIDGEEVRSKGGTFEDRSPNDQRILLGLFQKGTKADAKKAVESAKRAFPAWAGTDYKERARIFLSAADLISGRKFYVAALMSFENGKNRTEAIADVDEAIDLIRWYAGELVANNGFEKEMGRYVANERTKSVLKPYGVWAVIAPFNFPFAITAGMTAGAVLAGNTAVLKPASDTPYMALVLYDALIEAGLPPGVLNFVTGPGSTVGQELVDNPDVDGFVFTGSREVGLSAFRTFTAEFPKPIISEMGGKNATIVTAKANLDKAAEGVARAAFGYGGQKCSACSRVLVQKNVKDEFMKKLVAYTEKLRVGDPMLRDTFMGPVINEDAYEKYQKVAAVARKDGEVLIGGNARKESDLRHGFYVEPMIVDGLPLDHRFLKEELFIPVLAVATFESFDEAIEISNSTDYGLTGGIFSNDQHELDEFFRRAETGTVYANRTMGATTGAIVGAQPFVGWKMSGISGKGAGGHYYLQQFMREQTQTTYI
jgi:1-pyrroline-5-carboxylate dehydrogenase